MSVIVAHTIEATTVEQDRETKKTGPREVGKGGIEGKVDFSRQNKQQGERGSDEASPITLCEV